MSASSTKNLSAVLVANRGEIARRIFKTARQMGMVCIAVYTDADRDAPFVSEADQAVRLETSYLDGDAIIEAAKLTGADCIHPGYGFLSENADFARQVVKADLTWVGPSPETIAAMGDKIEAKRLASKADVPLLPSTEDPAEAAAVGFPLLVKAAAGGGGKGMRLVNEPELLSEAITAAKREAAGAFGDDRVFLERYVARSRHIEIQILGDSYGALVHLGERECSIQRRHQKIIEEAPSPRVDAELRRRMGSAALALAASINYHSVGTVEFLLDDETGDFFFLEVNTRLQVEHPVTEMVTGIDLVQQQLEVASGLALTFTQDDVTWTGHAIEARLYAEDPNNDFLPATGIVEAFVPGRLPGADNELVRWDSGIEAGSTIGVDFDPMLAKVIASGATRANAAALLARVLESTFLGGVTTNRSFLAATLRSDAFLAGDTTTDFIERVDPTVTLSPADQHLAAVIAAMWLQGRNRSSDDLWGFAPSNWRNAGLPAEFVAFMPVAGDEALSISYQRNRDGRFVMQSGEVVEVLDWRPTEIELVVDNLRFSALVTEADGRVHVQLPHTTVSLMVQPRFVIPGSELPTGGLVAPMPGVVVEVRCAPGDQVEAGQILVILEAMKMEHHIQAPFAGLVSDVPISAGQQLDNGQLLVTIDETPGPDDQVSETS